MDPTRLVSQNEMPAESRESLRGGRQRTIQKKKVKRESFIAATDLTLNFSRFFFAYETTLSAGCRSSIPSSPNSLASAAMDESDSDAEPAPRRGAATDGDDKYPVDGLFMSEVEKAEIMAMREVEREQILEERTTEIERQRQNRLLRQMVENEERKTVKKKRSADTAELDDSQRKPARQRATGKAETAMDSLRRARAEKAKRKEDNTRGRDYSPGRQGSNGAESEDDFGRARSRTPEKEEEKEAPPPDLKDFERIRLGRNEFAQVCFTPGFESAITGCYIRIALGPHPETGVEQYRMAVIKGMIWHGICLVWCGLCVTDEILTGFSNSRPYALTGPQGAFVTDQYVKASHGKAVKEFPFIAASSGKFTDVRPPLFLPEGIFWKARWEVLGMKEPMVTNASPRMSSIDTKSYARMKTSKSLPKHLLWKRSMISTILSTTHGPTRRSKHD